MEGARKNESKNSKKRIHIIDGKYYYISYH